MREVGSPFSLFSPTKRQVGRERDPPSLVSIGVLELFSFSFSSESEREKKKARVLAEEWEKQKIETGQRQR